MKIVAASSNRAFTLAEIVIASCLGMITIGASIYGYILSAQRAEWSGYSLAANSLALQRLEQARAAKWDPLAYTTNNDLLLPKNFPVVTTNILDIPMSGVAIVYATNYTTITDVSTEPPLRMIRVDCTWGFQGRGPFTNTVVTYRAPDQ